MYSIHQLEQPWRPEHRRSAPQGGQRPRLRRALRSTAHVSNRRRQLMRMPHFRPRVGAGCGRAVRPRFHVAGGEGPGGSCVLEMGRQQRWSVSDAKGQICAFAVTAASCATRISWTVRIVSAGAGFEFLSIPRSGLDGTGFPNASCESGLFFSFMTCCRGRHLSSRYA